MFLPNKHSSQIKDCINQNIELLVNIRLEEIINLILVKPVHIESLNEKE